MTGNPADVGGTKVDVAVVIVEDVFVGDGGIHHVTPDVVLHPFRLARRPGGVEQE